MDSKYGLLTDLHFGLKKNASIIFDWQLTAFNEAVRIFKENKVDSIIILGDVFECRDKNTTLILDLFLNEILEELRLSFKHVYILVGNHDMFYKNTRNVNILSTLVKDRYDNVTVIEEVTSLNYRYGNLLLVPWIVSEKDINLIINHTKKDKLLGHLEINGFRMTSQGRACEHGISQDIFKEYSLVLSGHFHLKDKIGNIQYLGTMMPLNFDEYYSDHSVYILSDTLKEYPLNVSMFDVLKFENRIYSIEELEIYKNKIVKIVVDDNTDSDLLEKLLRKLSDIAFSYTKKLLDNSKSSDEIDQNVKILSDEELITEYVENNTPDHIDSSIVIDLYLKLKTKAETEN